MPDFDGESADAGDMSAGFDDSDDFSIPDFGSGEDTEGGLPEESVFGGQSGGAEDAEILDTSGDTGSGDDPAGFDDFGDFSIPEESELPEAGDTFAEDSQPEEGLPDFTDNPLDLPEDEMFSLFSEAPADPPPAEEDSPDTPEPEAEDSSDFSIPDFDGTFPDMDESAGSDSVDMDLGGEADDGLPEEMPPADDGPLEESSSADSFDDFSIPDFDADFSGDIQQGITGEEGTAADGDGSAADEAGGDALDLGGEFFEEPGGGETPDADPFDSFSLDGDSLGMDFNIPDSDLNLDDSTFGDVGRLEEFSLPGIDDVFGGEEPGRPQGAGPAAGGGVSGGGEEVEEIQLSGSDLEKLEKTLASYPLNLRIAVEELIAEQAVSPDLMSALVKKLVAGAGPKETASLAGKILGRSIPIPKGFEKKTGEELEAEQSSFGYIFVHNFLPVLRIFLAVGIVAVSLFYLIYQFVYTPLRANAMYQRGYERIEAGQYARANENFLEALRIRRMKKWFFSYAIGFRDARQYLYAEQKYDELLRYYPRDKEGALAYADLETNYLRNFEKADRILRTNILNYSVDDREGLLALGDNNLAWGEVDPSRYEEARRAYARLMEAYGEKDEYLERMMKYFIRTDQLGEVLPLQVHFMSSPRTKISVSGLSELGGYLLDKRFEEVRGVPDENLSRIEGIRDILLRAVGLDPAYPEAHYHLSRYYSRFGNSMEERQTLENAIRYFDISPELSPQRVSYRINAQQRYAWLLTSAGEFFPAEEQLIKGIDIYEDAVRRRVLSRAPEFGRLYADLGDLEYFTKDGNMERAILYYRESRQNGWAPPEMLYRLGSAYYHTEQWAPSLENFFEASSSLPLNRRLLYALGNTSYLRGNYFAAQGYFNRLLDMLEAERSRFPMLLPHDRPEHMELAERLMVARNNLGVTLEALADRTGDPGYRSRAMALYVESARAWDALTRNPDTMIRMGAADLSGPGVNQAYLNSRNTLYPEQGYEPQIYTQIDKDVIEPSIWEKLAPPSTGLSGDIPFQVRE
ncbi:tetratricopeptide repeat protein [Breznakiella homolactica]|uniref:Tetratricopeptide repeat protein n=1 Tax=Breznakiella homolactica TaxID=2798577 RepID=A0A7T8BAZ8_9SPIR|nr:tetratricopeptide repeat protein [Breznakiella homolactica]